MSKTHLKISIQYTLIILQLIIPLILHHTVHCIAEDNTRMSSNYTTGSNGNGRRDASQLSSSSMTPSYRSQTIQNPYAKSKTLSQKSTTITTTSNNKSCMGHNNKLSQNLSSSSSSSSSSLLPNPIPPQTASSFSSSKTSSSSRHYDFKDLHNALREYCNHCNNSSNNQNDVNISFSVASHAIRQRKLLRNISFELKQLAKLNDDYNKQHGYRSSVRNTNSDDDYNFGNDYGGYASLMLKSVGCSSNDSNGAILSALNDQQIVGLILRVMDSVNTLLLEEYYERRESQCARLSQKNDDDLGVSYLNASGWNNNNNNYNNHNSSSNKNNNVGHGGDNVDSDSLLAILEFVNLAYSCLESNIVFASLRTTIDCEGFRCVDITKLDDDGDDHTTEQNDFCTVIDGLLFFTMDPNGNGIADESNSNQDEREVEGNDNSFAFIPSKSKWEPTSVQVLALSALTKAILNAEFIQRYSTSLSLLPEEGIDSLLGDDMGIGLAAHKEDMVRLVEMAMYYLSSILSKPKKDRRQLSNDQKNDNKLFQLACMSFLSCLFRTNASEWMLVQVSPSITQKMISNLHQCSSDALQIESNNKEYNATQYVTSVLAQSLLLIIEWKSPGSTKMETFREMIVDDKNICGIIQSIFGSKSSHEDVGLMYGGSIYLFIHLCITQNEKLQHVWKEEKMVSCIKEGIVQSFTVSDENECTNQGIFMVVLHFIIAFPQCRQLLNRIFDETERQGLYGSSRLGTFLKKTLGKGKDVSTFMLCVMCHFFP